MHDLQDPRQALDVAFGLMEDMQMVGVAANVHTYTALMNVCIKNREYERALQVCCHQCMSSQKKYSCTASLS